MDRKTFKLRYTLTKGKKCALLLFLKLKFLKHGALWYNSKVLLHNHTMPMVEGSNPFVSNHFLKRRMTQRTLKIEGKNEAKNGKFVKQIVRNTIKIFGVTFDSKMQWTHQVANSILKWVKTISRKDSWIFYVTAYSHVFRNKWTAKTGTLLLFNCANKKNYIKSEPYFNNNIYVAFMKSA